MRGLSSDFVVSGTYTCHGWSFFDPDVRAMSAVSTMISLSSSSSALADVKGVVESVGSDSECGRQTHR